MLNLPLNPNLFFLISHLSGTDDDKTEQELLVPECYPDTTASSTSTINSSLDVADGDGVKYCYSHTQEKIQFHPNGNVRELKKTKTTKTVVLPKKDESSNYVLLSIFAIATISLIVFGYTIYRRHDAPEPRSLLARCSFELSEREFPNQNKILWKSLELGVESVLNNIPTSPSIFLLAYEDVKSVNRITHSIVQRTTECMNSKVNALELSPADLAYSEMKTDYGVVITKYQNQLKRSGVMLVNDLNKVRPFIQLLQLCTTLHLFYLLRFLAKLLQLSTYFVT